MGLKKVGALWLKEGKKGKFMSGELQFGGKDSPRTRILVFKNTDKEPGSKQPDYTINMDADEDEQTQRARSEAADIFDAEEPDVPF